MGIPSHVRPLLVLAIALLAATSVRAQTPGIAGQWREPGGSVIQIAPCGSNLCARLIAISASAPSRVDGNNPKSSLRTRSLCGLEIGTGFHSSGPGKADGGMLYDPKSGKNYHGVMTAEGDTLALRGYVGIKAFGRSEKWTRTTGVTPCTK